MSMAIDREYHRRVSSTGRSGQASLQFHYERPAPVNASPRRIWVAIKISLAPLPCWMKPASSTATATASAKHNGVHELRVQYQTSTNAVRQNTQALIKQWWSEIGIETDLRNIRRFAVFFGGDPASPDTFQKFYSAMSRCTRAVRTVRMHETWKVQMQNYRCNEWPERRITTGSARNMPALVQ